MSPVYGADFVTKLHEAVSAHMKGQREEVVGIAGTSKAMAVAFDRYTSAIEHRLVRAILYPRSLLLTRWKRVR